MKITICDPCKKNDNVITETMRGLKVKGRSYLNIDICEKHGAELKTMAMPDYVRYVMKLNGIELTETDAEIKAKYL